MSIQSVGSTASSAAVPNKIGSVDTLCLYELTAFDDELVATTGDPSVPFDRTDYSLFKYGRRDIAERYAIALARLVSSHLDSVLQPGESAVILGTPYKRLPNAARLLALTVERLLRKQGLPTTYTYIYQHRLAAGDYGTLSLAERNLRNRQKKRYLDPDDFTGKHAVVIDDVWITGSIGQSIIAMLSDVDVRSITVANLVRLDPRIAQEQPHLEDQLNHYAVTGLADLLRIMDQRDRFVLTTRAVKYILQHDLDEISWLLERLDAGRIDELYEGVVDDGYDLMPCYREAFELIRTASI